MVAARLKIRMPALGETVRGAGHRNRVEAGATVADPAGTHTTPIPSSCSRHLPVGGSRVCSTAAAVPGWAGNLRDARAASVPGRRRARPACRMSDVLSRNISSTMIVSGSSPARAVSSAAVQIWEVLPAAAWTTDGGVRGRRLGRSARCCDLDCFRWGSPVPGVSRVSRKGDPGTHGDAAPGDGVLHTGSHGFRENGTTRACGRDPGD